MEYRREREREREMLQKSSWKVHPINHNEEMNLWSHEKRRIKGSSYYELISYHASQRIDYLGILKTQARRVKVRRVDR